MKWSLLPTENANRTLFCLMNAPGGDVDVRGCAELAEAAARGAAGVALLLDSDE